MLTIEQKLAYIQANIGQTRVKFNPESGNIDVAYKNVRNAIHKKSIKAKEETPRPSVESIVSTVNEIEELAQVEEQFKKAVEARKQAILEHSRKQLEQNIADLEMSLKKAKERLASLE